MVLQNSDRVVPDLKCISSIEMSKLMSFAAFSPRVDDDVNRCLQHNKDAAGDSGHLIPQWPQPHF